MEVVLHNGMKLNMMSMAGKIKILLLLEKLAVLAILG